MNRFALLALSTGLSISLVFSGCASKGKSPSGDPSNAGTKTADNSKVTPPGTFPIVKDKINMTIFAPQSEQVEDYNTNEYTKWYEEKTNIHINWDLVPSAGLQEKVRIKLAGGALPDVFMSGVSGSVTDSMLVMYGGQGLFVPLNKLIDQYAPNVKNMMQKSPWTKDYMVTPDGNIYSLPNAGEVFHTTMPKKGWIYKPWLDKLGLKVPTTTNEFYEALKAFKTKDPNGNGKADEIPYSGADGEKNSSNEVESFVMQSFTFYDRGSYFMVDNGKIVFAADKPEYKEGLKYLKKLMDEGLMPSESFVQDRKALTALAEDPSAPRLGAAAALYYGNFTVDNGPTGRYKEYVPMPVLKGPDGKAYGFDRGYSATVGSFVITKDCKTPEAAIRWIDAIYDFDKDLEMEYHPYFGKINTGWKKPDAGTKGIDGRDAKYEAIIPFGQKQNAHWGQSSSAYSSNDYRLSASAKGAELEVRLYDATKNLYKPYAKPEMKLPFMYFSEEQLTKSGDLKTAINKVVQTFQVKFITGSLDLEKDWNSYIKELDNAGLKEYVKLTQDVYDTNQKAKKK